MSKKLGIDKKSHHETVAEGTVDHKHVPGKAYTADPITKLITMIGGGFFNEPRYYDTNRSTFDFLSELASKGSISSTIVDGMGLTEQARDVIETAHAVAQGDSPEDLLVVAAWARDPKKGLKLRYTPQIMLCIAAANAATRPYVAPYATSIMQRADEIRQVFAAYRHLFNKKESGLYKGKLPLCLKRALGVAFAKQSLYGLLKYDSKTRPTFGDVLLTIKDKKIRGFLEKALDKKLDHWPLDRAVFEYFVNGKISNDAPNMLQKRAEFFKLKDAEKATPELLKEAGLTWENVISHFGSTKETWEMCIPLMGEMALTRNLRNFEQAGISDEAWDQVYDKCKSISDTKQLPFRFFSADREVSSSNAMSVVGQQLDNSCNNVPGLAGVTAIFVDNSGSATGCSVSGNSKLVVADAGNILAAIIAKKIGRKCHVGVFGDSCIWVPFSETDGCMNIKKKIDSVATNEQRSDHGALAINSEWARGRGVGGATETGLWCGIHDLTKRKVHVDRIIIVSDFCCYTRGDSHNCGRDMNKYFGKGGENATIQSMLDRYRQDVNSDCWVHSVDLQGYGQPQVKPGTKNTQLLSGWSEQVFGLMHQAEAANSQTPKEQQDIPTIDLLRERYAVEID